MSKIPVLAGAALLCFALSTSYAQTDESPADKVVNFPSRLLNRIQAKTASLNARLTRQTESYLQKMQRQEERMRQKLSSVDSAAAQQLFAGSAEGYAALARRMETDTGGHGRTYSGVYLPYLDSLQGSIAFLRQNPQLMAGVGGGQPAAGGTLLAGVGAGQVAQLQGANQQIQAYESKLMDGDQVKAYIQQRKQLIGQYIAQHTSLQGLLGKSYAGMNQEVYYYSQQLRAYKEMWNNPDQILQKALTLLNRLPAFQAFMKNNSLLGSLFKVPGNYGAAQAVSGLQTREQVAQLVQNQVSAGGAAGASSLESNLQSAEAQLDGYKSKLGALGAGNGDMDMPNFKPNDQKTKTFWKRLEYGTNFQTTHNSTYFPMTTDLGLSLAYKLGHNNLIGVGASYKLGWGNGIQDIAFSSQGVGLRSFLQIHIKGSFSATGGFEYNYTTPFNSYKQIKQLQYWTKSGLIGVTKTVSLKSRVFKNTSVSLLWDFLSYQQVPQTQPILFRIGYTF